MRTKKVVFYLFIYVFMGGYYIKEKWGGLKIMKVMSQFRQMVKNRLHFHFKQTFLFLLLLTDLYFFWILG